MTELKPIPPRDPSSPRRQVSAFMLAIDRLEVDGEGLLLPAELWAGRPTAPGSYIPAWFAKQRPGKRFSILRLPDKSGWTIHRVPDSPDPAPFRE